MGRYIWVLLQLVLDESKQVLLVHTGRVVDMGINLSDIVKVTVILTMICDQSSLPMRNSLIVSYVAAVELWPAHLHICKLLILIQ
jgi:hypothetical protein